MSSQCVTLINPERQVVATAHVAEQHGQFIGHIDCSLMPLPLQRLFTEYEEIVSTQVFSLLDDVEDHIARLHLRGIFEDGHEAVLTDVQIYPSTKTVSFQVVQGTVSPPGAPNKRLAGRRGIASARASLPPFPAPEAWRSAPVFQGAMVML